MKFYRTHQDLYQLSSSRIHLAYNRPPESPQLQWQRGRRPQKSSSISCEEVAIVIALSVAAGLVATVAIYAILAALA